MERSFAQDREREAKPDAQLRVLLVEARQRRKQTESACILLEDWDVRGWMHSARELLSSISVS
jgi:hypothetical protein